MPDNKPANKPDYKSANKQPNEETQQYNEEELNTPETREEQQENYREPSPLFKFFSTIFYIILLIAVGIALVLLLFSLDFLNVYTFRDSKNNEIKPANKLTINTFSGLYPKKEWK